MGNFDDVYENYYKKLNMNLKKQQQKEESVKEYLVRNNFLKVRPSAENEKNINDKNTDAENPVHLEKINNEEVKNDEINKSEINNTEINDYEIKNEEASVTSGFSAEENCLPDYSEYNYEDDELYENEEDFYNHKNERKSDYDNLEEDEIISKTKKKKRKFRDIFLRQITGTLFLACFVLIFKYAPYENEDNIYVNVRDAVCWDFNYDEAVDALNSFEIGDFKVSDLKIGNFTVSDLKYEKLKENFNNFWEHLKE